MNITQRFEQMIEATFPGGVTDAEMKTYRLVFLSGAMNGAMAVILAEDRRKVVTEILDEVHKACGHET